MEKIVDPSTAQMEQTYRVNVFGLFWLCKAALPLMSPGGSIITTASIQATHPSPSLLDSAPTKAAISRVHSRGTSPKMASGSTALRPDRCGHHYKRAVASRIRRFPRLALRRQ